MPSPAYIRFEESTHLNYVRWHDGEPYDLAAIAEMTEEERATVEKDMIARLSGTADWRDVEALAALKTPAAAEAINTARKHTNPEVRKRALEVLAEASVGPIAAIAPDPAQLDAEIARAVKQGAIDMALDHPTPAVKKALLDLARLGDDVQRVNGAAMLMYLCGQAKEPFDWEQRPFFLRFNAEGHDLYIVWHELKAKVGL
jgi:hypothetical protein